MGETIEILDGAEGYVEGDASAPGVVVIQEWWGLVPHIKDICGRLAKQGYQALAPDLYHGESTVEAEEAQHLMEGLDWGRAVEEITGAVKALRERGAPKVGVVGFCMGGALSCLASANSGVDAAVAFYGFPPDKSAMDKECPPTLIFFGEDEGFFSVPDAQAWAEGRAGCEVVVYPGAGHAFFNDTRPEAYHEASAKDAWQKTLDHFESHL